MSSAGLAPDYPLPSRQRAIITSLQSHDTGSHVYAVAKSWYRKWQRYTGASADQIARGEGSLESRSKVRSTKVSPESTEEVHGLADVDSRTSSSSSDLAGSSEVTRDGDSSNTSQQKSSRPQSKKQTESPTSKTARNEENDSSSSSSSGPQTLDKSPGPLTMDTASEAGNMWVDETVWVHWVSWYGVDGRHQLDRRHWASEEHQYEVCVLSPYAGIVSNPHKMLDNSERTGWVEMQLRHMFQVSAHTPTRLWACEKQRSARFRPLLDRSHELCFLLSLDKTYILALELCNNDDTWPTRVPGESVGDFQQYEHLTRPAPRSQAAWEAELSVAVETVFQAISGELQDTVQGVVATARCVTERREMEVATARDIFKSRLVEVDQIKATIEDKSRQLVKQEEVVRAEAQTLSTVRASLEAERGRLAKEMLAMEALNRRTETKVRLNVGGSVYTTSMLTLTRDPDSMLAAMFSGRHQLSCEEDGAYFIDRDGTHFRYILNYLRDGGFRPGTLPMDTTVLSEILAEAEYYQIAGLATILSTAMQSHDLYGADHVTPEKLESPGRRILRKIVHKK